MKGLIISGCFIVLSKPEFLDLTSFLHLEWLQSAERKEGDASSRLAVLFLVSGICSGKKGQQKVPTLQRSHRKPAV